MDICFGFFASPRYWKEREELEDVYHKLAQKLVGSQEKTVLLTGEEELPQGDLLVVVPMSGAVQQDILRAAQGFSHVLLYAAYAKGNTFPEAESAMLLRNAAPTFMDCWAVLHRVHPDAQIAVDRVQLDRVLRVFGAYGELRQSRLLLIGETEPWVVSSSRELSRYAALGIDVVPVAQEELAELYRETPFSECSDLYTHFMAKGTLREPSVADMEQACRMARALQVLLERYGADGAAVACFNLLKTGTTCCLGASYLNDVGPWVVACEGDLDSAVTMLMLKKLGVRKVWMANPVLCPGGEVQFSHCTAPVWETNGWILRSHHESGIGVSVESFMPSGTVTGCRISAKFNAAAVWKGEAYSGERLPVCRSQLYVRFEEPERYLQTSLGCHLVFAFEDCRQEMTLLSRFMGLQIE